MDKLIDQLHDHYVVCGVSGVVRHVIRELQATERPVVLVTRDQRTLDEQAESLGFQPLSVLGEASANETLLMAGIERARGLFAADLDDRVNLMVVLTAHHLNPGLRIVSHCRDPENEPKLRWVGANAVVSGERIGGLRMASEMIRPTAVTFLDAMMRDPHRNFRVEELTLPEGLAPLTLGQVRSLQSPDLLILATRDLEWRYNPPDDALLEPRTQLVVMTTPAARLELEERLAALAVG